MKIFKHLLMMGILFIPFSGIALEVNPDGYGGNVQKDAIKHAIPDLLDEEEALDQKVDEPGVADPLEGWNRKVFTFNDTMYEWVLKPVKKAYTFVVPQEFRICFGNFFTNLGMPVRAVNALLQGRVKDAGIEVSRFAVNTTIGVFGFGDIAEDAFGLHAQRADFGQTLGRYGVGSGVYIFWPFFGPSTVRDTFGIATDYALNPVTYANFEIGERISINGVEFVNKISVQPNVYEDLKMNSLDPYVAMRQAYIDYRANVIQSATK